MIGQDRWSVINEGWRCWRRLAHLCGWEVPDSKSPPPHWVYLVVGYEMDHTRVPLDWAYLRIAPKRVRALLKILGRVLQRKR